MEQSTETNKMGKWILTGCLKIMSLNYRIGEACLAPFPDPHILSVIGFIWYIASASHLKPSILPNAERVAPGAQARPPKPACSVMSLLAQLHTIR